MASNAANPRLRKLILTRLSAPRNVPGDDNPGDRCESPRQVAQIYREFFSKFLIWIVERAHPISPKVYVRNVNERDVGGRIHCEVVSAAWALRSRNWAGSSRVGVSKPSSESM